MKTINRTLMLALCLVFSARLSAQRAAKLDSIFTALYNTGQFSGNVLVAENGNAIYQKSFGMANLETQVPVNQDTRFLLGSVSKQFTAMGIVLLHQAGKLNYDDELVKYIPELPYKGITIRQILNHISGLPDYDALMNARWDKSKYATNNDIIAMLVQYHPNPFFAPGQKYLYSNTGYALLAVVIERISGMSFTDYMESKVFGPLGMKHTLIYTRRTRPRAVNNYALGYVYSDSLKQFVLPDNHPIWKQYTWEDGVYGEDGVNTTTGDLLKWDQTIYHKLFVPAAEWALILTPGTPLEGASDYGFGWHIINPQGIGRIAYHSGGWPGYIAYNEQHLDQNQTIIILRNKYVPQIRMPIDAIRAILQLK